MKKTNKEFINGVIVGSGIVGLIWLLTILN